MAMTLSEILEDTQLRLAKLEERIKALEDKTQPLNPYGRPYDPMDVSRRVVTTIPASDSKERP